jgi:Clr5 domain
MATVTKLDWNAHKAIIRSLYLDENRKLAEVMRMMATEHKFSAT